MRLEDTEVAGQQELFDREQEAETRRVMREASTAFAKAMERPAAARLSPSRQKQVALAEAVISALGTNGYDASNLYAIGGAR